MKRKSCFIGLIALAVSLMLASGASAAKETWYLDNDGDGYGSDVSERVNPNNPPEGYVPVSGDCNDIDTSTYPGATEVVADGVDQDCDTVDNCYEDLDGDSYGTVVVIAGGTDLTCANAGESTVDLDCDDTNSDINPGVAEISGDPVDQNCDGDTGPYFPDNRLNYCVGLHTASGNIDLEDLATVRILNCGGPMGNLDGMQYFGAEYQANPKLEKIILQPYIPCMWCGPDRPPQIHTFDTLAPLANITSLTDIHIESAHNISNLSPLGGLVNLINLNLVASINVNPSTLPSLPSLTFLGLRMVGFTDLTDFIELKYFPNLQKLQLRQNFISDVSLISEFSNQLPNLRELELDNNSISDVSPFSDFSQSLPNLWALHLNSNNIFSIEDNTFTNFGALEHLNLGGNYISDMSPFTTALPDSLYRLTLSGNCITDLSPFDIEFNNGSSHRLYYEGEFRFWVAGLQIPNQQNCLGPVPVRTAETSAGQIWMAHNLGASWVAQDYSDLGAYGDLYQWGRGKDGHQLRTSGITTELSETSVPDHSNFILGSGFGYDWLVTRDSSLWQGALGPNNPCPEGFRLPTETEWNMERWSWQNNGNGITYENSPLNIVGAGQREAYTGDVLANSEEAYYWSSTVSSSLARLLVIDHAGTITYIGEDAVLSQHRSMGASVRCIQD